MAEDKRGAAAGGESSGSGVISPKMIKSGDRQLVKVELRPGETTYVSWRKLIKETEGINGSSAPAPAAVPNPPPNAHPNLQSRMLPGQPAEKEGTDEPQPNRFSAVIEKIERLYMGKDSSDEEELDDTPDDDQYDTEDSFIDDKELDEYFEVDNSALKHDGFFINRGKLERINEPAEVPSQQPKKRRKKDVAKNHVENAAGRGSNKQVKASKAHAASTEPLLERNSSIPRQNLSVISEHHSDVKSQEQPGFSGVPSRKRPTDTEMISDPSLYLKDLNGDASVPVSDAKVIEKAKTGVQQSKHIVTNKVKDAGGPSGVSRQKYIDKNAYADAKFQSRKLHNNVEHHEPLVAMREKNGIRELPDLNVEVKYSMQTTKSPQVQRKDGSVIRSKGSMLEKAIRELEKSVAESRPHTLDNQEADPTSQGIKRRLPREIKQRLFKVARLGGNQGKVPKELLNRLMSILGHLIQLRTLKRNLKEMINENLSATKEKDNRLQQIKKEVIEMISAQVPHLESKAYELPAGASDDFQDIGSDEKGAVRKKISMDTALEDKICDLYDLFIDGLDEAADRQLIRKLYVELAGLWPNGLMNNHDIRQAITRSKDRRKAIHSRHEDREKVKRKKMVTARLDENFRVEASPSTQQPHSRERMAAEPILALTTTSKLIPSTTAATVRTSSPSTNGSSLDRSNQDKLKVTSTNAMDEPRMADGNVVKKKAKRKPEADTGDAHPRPEKLAAQHSDERPKSVKPSPSLTHKPNIQLNAPPSCEQSS